jgi:hypothetical protein
MSEYPDNNNNMTKLIKVKTIDKSTNIGKNHWEPYNDVTGLPNDLKGVIRDYKVKQKQNENLYVEIGDVVLLSLKEQKELEFLSKDFNDIASDIVEDYDKNPSEWPSGSGVFISGDSEYSRDVLEEE